MALGEEEHAYIPNVIEMLRCNPQPMAEGAAYLLDVVVQVYNAFQDLKSCLHSLFTHQDIYRVTLIDDCSTDSRVRLLVEALERQQCPGFALLRNERNLGYLRTANRALAMTKGDVLLLNSDTIVTSGWARKMRDCAYSRDRVATVTPFTNSGNEVSIPMAGRNNEIPRGFTVDSFADLVERSSSRRYPELITAVGFCMYVRRAVIDEIGYFDPVNYGTGYGEENDFSIRATHKGYVNLLCDDTFVYHKVGASFKRRRNLLIERGRVALARMYPDFWPAVNAFRQSDPLRDLRDNIRRAIAAEGNIGAVNRHRKVGQNTS